MLANLKLASKIKSIIFCPSGDYLAVGLQNGTIFVYKILVDSEVETKATKPCK